MPAISLRLTDEQHAQLRAWAYGAQRSIQREIIYRLFALDEPTPAADAPAAAPAAAATSEATSEQGPPPDSCGLAGRHHLYTRRKPCPRCGYPRHGA